MLVPSQHASVARRAVRYRPLDLRIGLALNCDAAAQQAAANADSVAPAASTLKAVQVKGVRSSVKGAIAIKQSNAEISDSIVAEDIGKLPERGCGLATRDRRAGGARRWRSGQVPVRGSPVVITTLVCRGHPSAWHHGQRLFRSAAW